MHFSSAQARRVALRPRVKLTLANPLLPLDTAGVRSTITNKRHLQAGRTRVAEAGSGRGKGQRREATGVHRGRDVRFSATANSLYSLHLSASLLFSCHPSHVVSLRLTPPLFVALPPPSRLSLNQHPRRSKPRRARHQDGSEERRVDSDPDGTATTTSEGTRGVGQGVGRSGCGMRVAERVEIGLGCVITVCVTTSLLSRDCETRSRTWEGSARLPLASTAATIT